MIKGHGVDILNIDRIKATYQRFGEKFIKKILSQTEIDNLQKTNVVHMLAKHWVVKEAVSKAIGCGLINGSKLHFKDIVLSKDSFNKPMIILNEKIQNIIAETLNLSFHEKNNIFIHISTSDDDNIMIASAILEVIDDK